MKKLLSIPNILIFLFSTLSTIELFGPILPLPWFHIGWAGVFNHIASFIAFGTAYYRNKDKLWLILLASVPTMLISDLYFFPIFPFLQMYGMWIFGVISVITISIGLSFYSKTTKIKYANVLTVFMAPISFLGFVRGSPLGLLTILWLGVLAYSLADYGLKNKNHLFATGSVIRFGSQIFAVLWYYFIGGPTRPLIATLTDRISIFSRTLVALSAMLK